MHLDDETRHGDINIVALNYVDGSHEERQALIRVVDSTCFGSFVTSGGPKMSVVSPYTASESLKSENRNVLASAIR